MERKRYFKEKFIGDRRFELFKRDPLANEMESLFRKSHSDNISEDDKDKLSHRIEGLARELMKKWNFHFLPHSESQHIPSEPFSWFTFSSDAFTVADAGEYVEDFKKKLETDFKNTRLPSFEHFESKGWIFKYLDGGYDDRGNVYIPVPPGSVPIIVDIGGLTEKSKDKVTEEIWNIIKRKIKEKRTNAEGPWKNIPAVRDPKEVGFISAMAEDTFVKYLKWYDLHMGGDNQTAKGLPFRNIAFLEFVKREHPDKFEETKRRIAERTKSIKTKSGKEKEIKGYIGQPVKGEDIVEKGVKLIYRAIHRKAYPSKKRQELYNCPQHGNVCPHNCLYLKKWRYDFNKRKMLFKPLVTTDKIDSAPDEAENDNDGGLGQLL